MNTKTDYIQHLNGARLQWRRYEHRSTTTDHDHCNVCFATFSDFERPDILHEGYTTCDEYPKGECYEWVCQSCFERLQFEMGWTVVGARLS
jgi:hypothetical protein